MKKLLALFAVPFFATAMYSQGLVNGVNASSTDIYAISNGVVTAIAGSATATYDFELLTAPSTVPTGPLLGYPSLSALQSLLSGPWSDTGLTFQNSGIAGRASFPSGSTVNNWPGSTAQSYVVVGWSANLGSWAQVQYDITTITAFIPSVGGLWISPTAPNGYLGVTVVGNVVSGATGSGAGPNIWGTVVTGSSGINTTTALYPIIMPEPTTSALSGLGAATLFLFRHRKVGTARCAVRNF